MTLNFQTILPRLATSYLGAIALRSSPAATQPFSPMRCLAPFIDSAESTFSLTSWNGRPLNEALSILQDSQVYSRKWAINLDSAESFQLQARLLESAVYLDAILLGSFSEFGCLASPKYGKPWHEEVLSDGGLKIRSEARKVTSNPHPSENFESLLRQVMKIVTSWETRSYEFRWDQNHGCCQGDSMIITLPQELVEHVREWAWTGRITGPLRYQLGLGLGHYPWVHLTRHGLKGLRSAIEGYNVQWSHKNLLKTFKNPSEVEEAVYLITVLSIAAANDRVKGEFYGREINLNRLYNGLIKLYELRPTSGIIDDCVAEMMSVLEVFGDIHASRFLRDRKLGIEVGIEKKVSDKSPGTKRSRKKRRATSKTSQ